MKHAEIFTRLAQRSDPIIPILDAAMDEIAALEAENARMKTALSNCDGELMDINLDAAARRLDAMGYSCNELSELREQLAAAQKVIDAAGNLIAQKGRHNTEIAYKRLAKAIAEQKEGK